MTPLSEHEGAEPAPEPAHLVVRGGSTKISKIGSTRSHTAGRVAAVTSALACISGVATWVGGTGGMASRRGGADELLAAAHFGAAKAQLSEKGDKVTRQLYAAEDQHAKTGFRVTKDQALVVQQLEQKVEKISAQLKGPTVVRLAREMMLAHSNAFAALTPKPAAGGAKVISLSDMGAIIKAVKVAEGETSSVPSSPAQPTDVNNYLPGLYGSAAVAAAPTAPTAAQIATPQVKQGSKFRLQLKAQDKQIIALLQDVNPPHISNAKIEAALSSAVSDMSTRLHTQNPIILAVQLGVTNPVNVQEPDTPAQAAAIKAAHLKKDEEIDGLLLESENAPEQLKSVPNKNAILSKARTKVLADGSPQEQMPAAEEAKEHHTEFVKALAPGRQVRRMAAPAGEQVDHPSLDQDESNQDQSTSLFQGHQAARLPGMQASKPINMSPSGIHRYDTFGCGVISSTRAKCIRERQNFENLHGNGVVRAKFLVVGLIMGCIILFTYFSRVKPVARSISETKIANIEWERKFLERNGFQNITCTQPGPSNLAPEAWESITRERETE